MNPHVHRFTRKALHFLNHCHLRPQEEGGRGILRTSDIPKNAIEIPARQNQENSVRFTQWDFRVNWSSKSIPGVCDNSVSKKEFILDARKTALPSSSYRRHACSIDTSYSRKCWCATRIDGDASAVGLQPLYGTLGSERAPNGGGSERLRRLRQWGVSSAYSS